MQVVGKKTFEFCPCKDIGCQGRLEYGKHAEISRSFIKYTQENVVSHEGSMNDFAGVLPNIQKNIKKT